MIIGNGLKKLAALIDEEEEKRENHIKELDKKKYVMLLPSALNNAIKKFCPNAKDIHIFEADEKGRICKSCCGKFILKDEISKIDNYKESHLAPKMRGIVLHFGRNMCGRCVASLYGNSDTSEIN